MEAAYVLIGLIGLGLLISGIVIACITNKKHSQRRTPTPPPLPTRANTVTPLITPDYPVIQTRNILGTPSLPPRRSIASYSAYVSRNAITSCCGPRGVKPVQFPCCPFDKQRNVPGERQLIFWDNNANCYYCSRGHRFKSNGKLLVAN